jgi:phosphoribosylformimino-5-aminoimidazole carboxamide ribotide isomerase
MLIFPAIDLRGGLCVRLTQGRKGTANFYDTNPLEAALAFQTAGAARLHVVDLDGAFAEQNTRNRQVLQELVGVLAIPIQFGGGLRSIKDVEQVLELGIDRVVIGTVAAESIQMLAQMIQLFGADRVAVGIDAHNGMVMTHGWERSHSTTALTLAHSVDSIGIERVIYTDIQRDGTLTGPNLVETLRIAETGLKVTASGGISSLEDLKALNSLGIDSAIIGKALYEGRFTLQEALSAASS